METTDEMERQIYGLASLNRTMQYGNFKMKLFKLNKKTKFKSYYVVWKLCIIMKKKNSP